ncbi:MAG: aspartate kinase [Spirochaetales bacterium]|nr:aspartate kinase [Spirochaetales bacterium]
MKVMKFGGSSITSGEDMKTVAQIVQQENRADRVVVVLSAMKGITDLLISGAEKAECGDLQYRDNIEDIKKAHLGAINDLFPSKAQSEIIPQIATMLNEIEELLHGIKLVKECSIKSLDLIMSFGERLSCTLLTAYLNSIGCKAELIDARDMIITNRQFGSAKVLFDQTYKKIPPLLSKAEGIPVVTGFIASTENGITTTLGRNGSDYTASLIGAGIKADCIEIWKDVDGVMSCDPKLVKTAFVISELTYQEAMELSYFGAEVLHPYTMIPAIEKGIRIRIKNVGNPQAPGSVIADIDKRHTTQITGISCIDSVAILNIEGSTMIGVPGMTAHILAILAKAYINIVMISQASSENSICLVLKESEAMKAVTILNDELSNEIKSKGIAGLGLKKDMIIIAIVGENMRGTPGISGKLFGVLGEEGINVYAIAQGSSERNISLVTSKKDKDAALIALHKSFLED